MTIDFGTIEDCLDSRYTMTIEAPGAGYNYSEISLNIMGSSRIWLDREGVKKLIDALENRLSDFVRKVKP